MDVYRRIWGFTLGSSFWIKVVGWEIYKRITIDDVCLYVSTKREGLYKCL